MRYGILVLAALTTGAVAPRSAAAIAVNTIPDSVTPASTIRESRFTAANGATIYYTNPFDNSTRFADDLVAFDLATGTTQEVVSDTTFVRVEANDGYLVYNHLTDGSGTISIDGVRLDDGSPIPSIGEVAGRDFALQSDTLQHLDTRESGPFSRGPGHYSTDLRTGTEVFLDPRGLPFTEVDPLTQDVAAFTKDRQSNGNPVQPALVSPMTGARTTLSGPDGRNDVIQGVVVDGDRALVQYGPRSDLYLFDLLSETYAEIALERGDLDATREVGLGSDHAVYVNKLGQIMAYTVATAESFVVYDPQVLRSSTEAITVFDNLVVWNETYANGATAVRYAVIPEPMTAGLMLFGGGLILTRRRRMAHA